MTHIDRMCSIVSHHIKAKLAFSSSLFLLGAGDLLGHLRNQVRTNAFLSILAL